MLTKKKTAGLLMLISGLVLAVFFIRGNTLIKNIFCTEGIILTLNGILLLVSTYKNTSDSNNSSINKLSVLGLLLGTSGVMAFWFPWLGFALAGVGLILSAVCYIMASRLKSVTLLIIISLFVSLSGVNVSGFFTLKTISVANSFSLKYKEIKRQTTEDRGPMTED